MKVLILAGGFGTRISEESYLKPKPMIEIDGKPILWHIMKHYSYYGFNEFIILSGYKQHVIKEYFSNYFLYNSDITFDFTDNSKMIVHSNTVEPWKVSIIDTGLNTLTGGRLKRVSYLFQEGETFMMSYGDGVSDVDLNKLLETHNKSGKDATITIYNPGQRFGIVETDQEGVITKFREKAKDYGSMINIGYMVLNTEVFRYIDGDDTSFEKEVLEKLSDEQKLFSYKHFGFWQNMDTKRDHDKLEKMIEEGDAPWIIW